MASTLTNSELHPFESAGLGLAPFRYCGMVEKVYSAAPGHSQPAGTCDYCGQGIKYCCQIRSSDGRQFIVGCDCVRKLDRADNRLLSAMERDIAKQAKAKRDAERQAKWAEQCAERDRQLQAQRERNGGLTDSEVRENERVAELSRRIHGNTAKFGWLLEVLRGVNGEFAEGMRCHIAERGMEGLSERCVDIIRDIYSKSTGGRRGSKAYEAAGIDFCNRFEEARGNHVDNSANP